MTRGLTLDTASKPTMLQSASMPLYANSDWDALRTAIRSLNCKDYRQVKIVRIKHPQCMSGIQVDVYKRQMVACRLLLNFLGSSCS